MSSPMERARSISTGVGFLARSRIPREALAVRMGAMRKSERKGASLMMQMAAGPRTSSTRAEKKCGRRCLRPEGHPPTAGRIEACGVSELASKYFETALASIKRRDYEHAAALLVETIKLKPDFYEAWVARANCLAASDRPFDALLNFERALAI